MNILFLAPQPFFSERGTPIAVNLVLQELSDRGDRVDVLTYHLGEDVSYGGIQLYRTRNLPFIRQVQPGFSLKKVICDFLMVLQVLPMVWRGNYQIVHAVEEAVFIALLIKWLFGIPYVYDMDSALSQQMLDRYPVAFKPFAFLLAFAERVAIRNAKAVVPVCDALSDQVEKYKPQKVHILRDVSLLPDTSGVIPENLRVTLGIEGPLLMYVGNLESYQGIDLLLESFALALKINMTASLVIIGGKAQHIANYQEKARKLDIGERVHFLGPKPLNQLANYLGQADILVSPRVKGNNTPMKVYSYLDSGKALLATRLPTHTQVLNNQVALLEEPSPRTFSRGVLRLLEDKRLRRELGLAGKRLVREQHSREAFRNSLNTLYDWLRVEIESGIDPSPNKPFSGLKGFFR